MSITRRLTIGLVLAAALLASASSLVLLMYVRSAMLHQLDNSLIAQAHALGSLVRVMSDGHYQLDFDDAVIPEYAPHRRDGFYEVRYADGRMVERSPSLGEAHLSERPANTSNAWNVSLPNGRPGRAIQVSVVPVADDIAPVPNQFRPFAPVNVLVAQDRTPFDRTVDVLAIGLMVALAASLVIFAIALRAIVRRAMTPVYAMAHRATTLGPETLHIRFDTAALPAELLPIAQRMNDLIERLETAFQRERRIGSDIAHELRTPISELRTLADVACRWTPDPDRVPGMMADVRSVAVRMDRLVAALLTLARSNGVAAAPMQGTPVSLNRMIEDWQQRAAMTHVFTIDVPADCIVAGDELLLGQLIGNLLDNANVHADAGSAVAVAASSEADTWAVTVTNAAAGVTASDLMHLFEPFWRKDASRTSGQHAGLGLSLVASYATRMGFTVTPSITPDGRFEIRLGAMPAWQQKSPAVAAR